MQGTQSYSHVPQSKLRLDDDYHHHNDDDGDVYIEVLMLQLGETHSLIRRRQCSQHKYKLSQKS